PSHSRPHARLSLAPPGRANHVREACGRRRVPCERPAYCARKRCRGSTPAPPRDSIMQYGEFGFLNFGLVLLAAAVLSVPIARRLGLSAIVAYLIAGIIIGPYGLAAFGTPESIIPVSELGVVMLLFLRSEPSSPVCCSPNRTIDTSSPPTSSHSAVSCWPCSSWASA